MFQQSFLFAENRFFKSLTKVFYSNRKSNSFPSFFKNRAKKIARIRIRAICNINLNLLSCSDRYLNQSIKSKLLGFTS
ncbi:hypothetical protein BFAG_04184 [Bacteroides fragilis 3_1_12]|uniref:Uncharacterized protein n=1 Tax=Bacteroides fragilis 3_1_12 TaxID=457424 RepID=A0ABN0BRG0_BACFG|nr:hypothetical protein BFAG_04184 [Bacteroides fragilis 3_1_12]